MLFALTNVYAIDVSFHNEPIESDSLSSSNAVKLQRIDITDNHTEPTTYAESTILIDVDASKILYEKNSEERKYPASTTKLLTALVVLENCPDLSQTATVSYYAVHSVPDTYSSANLLAGEVLTLNDLLYVMMIASANEASFVLAQYVACGGNTYLTDNSEEAKQSFTENIAAFSVLMNKKATELGCLDSHFVNPNGIFNEEHYSTAYDLGLIGVAGYRNETIRTIAKTIKFELPNTALYTSAKRIFYSTNALLKTTEAGYYKYANGLKTGYTDLAGNCIIASASNGERNLVAVVLHGRSSNEYATSREKDCKEMFEFGFNEFNIQELVSEKSFVRNISIFNGSKETRNLNLIAKNKLIALLKDDQVLDITPTITLTKTTAPIAAGETCGYATYKVDGYEYTVDLIAETPVDPIDSVSLLKMAMTIVAIILITIFIFTHYERKKFKRK